VGDAVDREGGRRQSEEEGGEKLAEAGPVGTGGAGGAGGEGESVGGRD
jgi:hypothetical protein